MRKYRLFALIGVLLAVSRLSAQEQYIYADQVNIEPGGNAEVVVNMNLDLEAYEKVGLCFFLLDLPTGIEVTNSENPAKSCTLSAELVGELDESSQQKAFQVYPNYGKEGRLLLYLDVNKCSSTLKDSHGELLRMSVRSTLGMAMTFVPEISYVHIADDKGIPLVTDGVRDMRPDYNTLYIDDVEACTGDELVLSVKMRNKVPCEAFSFLLFIPGGTSFVKDDEGNPLATLSYERISPSAIETFEVNMKDDYMLRVLVTTNGTPFSGNDGEVFTVRIRIGETMPEGSYDVMLYNVSVADVNAVSYDIAMKSSRLKVSNLHRGDANGDGNLTVADMTAIAHYVMGNPPSGFSASTADANQDGRVNVADYTAVAHLLLYGTIETPAQTPFYYYYGKKMPLTLNKNKVCVSIPKEHGEICKRILANVQVLATINDTDFFDIFVISRSDYEKLTSQDFWEEDAKSVILTSSYFTESNEEVYATPYLNVKLKREQDTDLLNSYAEKYRLRIVRSSLYMPLWYILSVTPESDKSPLDCANELWESGDFEHSQPDLAGYGLDAAATARNYTRPSAPSESNNTVYIAPAKALAGQETALSVRMKNAVDAEGFQFNLNLPEGVSLVLDGDGLPEVRLSEERTTAARTNTFTSAIQSDGSLTVMAASTNGSAISAGDGEVCTVKLRIASDMAEGDYALLLRDIAISDTQAKSHDVELVEGKLTIGSGSAISEIVNRKFVDSKCYDLQGRRLQSQISNLKSQSSIQRKGMYIQDGKKYVK